MEKRKIRARIKDCQKGFGDKQVVIYILAAAIAYSSVLSCNSCVKKMKYQRDGFIEVPEDYDPNQPKPLSDDE